MVAWYAITEGKRERKRDAFVRTFFVLVYYMFTLGFDAQKTLNTMESIRISRKCQPYLLCRGKESHVGFRFIESTLA